MKFGMDIDKSNTRSKAGLNLAKGCTDHFVQVLKAGAVKHGMLRGPVTHGALAHPLVVWMSWEKHYVFLWATNLKSDAYGCQLMANRAWNVADWDSSPTQEELHCG